jgi:hypothetical protein
MGDLNLTAMVLATGAVGTAAFGIVEALKWTCLGLIGYGRIETTLGTKVMQAVERAYGSGFETYLEGLYRQGRGKGGLGKALRQGVRIGLTGDSAADLAQAVEVVDPAGLAQAARKLQSGGVLDGTERSVVGRFELAVDARIDAALALAEANYKGGMQFSAMLVALGLALLAACSLDTGFCANWKPALVVGIAAVPLAPIAKDVASGIQSARRAMGAKS